MPEARWRPTRPVVDALVVGLLLLALGALVGRADVAVLAVAPVLAAERLLRSRPRDRVAPSASASVTPEARLTTRVVLRTPPEARAVRVRASLPGSRTREAVVAVDRERVLLVATRSMRTGPQPAPALEYAGLGPGAGSRSEAGDVRPPALLVAPRAVPLRDMPLPARLRGVAGTHEARRLGEGGSLRDVHPFTPGDRLSRIDWRTTARRSTPTLQQVPELWVRRTQALAEATVTLVVDSRDDVGPDPGTWRDGLVASSDRTSLDLAREAAASLAQHYLATGDRVAVEDLGRRRRPLRAGAGRRHLDRVVHQLARMAPEGEPLQRVRAPQITSGSLVYVISTFLDPQAALVARQWHASGHRVVAVDVLPPLRAARQDHRQALALRVVRMRREDRLAELAAAGVPYVSWSERPASGLLALARRERRR